VHLIETLKEQLAQDKKDYVKKEERLIEELGTYEVSVGLCAWMLLEDSVREGETLCVTMIVQM
jgi:hypothetical protein